jgi:chromosome segregation ATPase
MSEIQNLLTEKEQLSSHLMILEDNVKNLEIQMEDQRLQINQTGNESQLLQENNKKILDESSQLQYEYSLLTVSVTQFSKQLDELRAKLLKKKNRISDLEKELVFKKREVSKMLNSLNEKAFTLRNTIEKSNSKPENINSRQNESYDQSEINSQLDVYMNKIKEEIQIKDQKINVYIQQIMSQEEEISQLMIQINSFKKENQELKEFITSNEKLFEDLDTNLQDKISQIYSLDQTVAQLKKELQISKVNSCKIESELNYVCHQKQKLQDLLNQKEAISTLNALSDEFIEQKQINFQGIHPNQDKSKFQFSSEQKDVMIAELTEQLENIHILIKNTYQNFSSIINSPHQSTKGILTSILSECNKLFQSQNLTAIM